jgi:hypothetical protein
MDDGRRRELEALLRGHLAEQRDDGLSRLLWLAEQLENYVERWIGFGEAMKGDLFGMVEIGARVTDEEIRRATRPSGLQRAWDDFVEGLAEIRAGTHSRPAALRESLSRFRATLA